MHSWVWLCPHPFPSALVGRSKTCCRFEGIDLEFKDLMKSVSYTPTVVIFCSEVGTLGYRSKLGRELI